MSSDSESSTHTAKAKSKYDCFGPPLDRRKDLRDRKAAFESCPLDKLPRGLYPKKNQAYRPPVFHLGYVVNNAWCIKIAKENNLYKSVVIDGKELWDSVNNRDEVLEFVIKKAGISSFFPKLMAIAPHPGMIFDGWLLTIYSNYRHLERLRVPSAEDIEKLRTFLQREEKPKWYLSSTDWYWGPRSLVYPY